MPPFFIPMLGPHHGTLPASPSSQPSSSHHMCTSSSSDLIPITIIEPMLSLSSAITNTQKLRRLLSSLHLPAALMASSMLWYLLELLVFLLLSSSFSLSFEPVNMEVEALIGIRRSLNDPHGALSNWDEYSVDPCSWAMITCSSENLVIGL